MVYDFSAKQLIFPYLLLLGKQIVLSMVEGKRYAIYDDNN